MVKVAKLHEIGGGSSRHGSFGREMTWQEALEKARHHLNMGTSGHVAPRKESGNEARLRRAAEGKPLPEVDIGWLLEPHNYWEVRGVMMTPAACEKLLDTLKSARDRGVNANRKLLPADIAKYARVQAAGLWRLTNLGMAVDTAGHLQDGANRATACILAGCSFPVAIFVGMPQGNYVNLDSGRPRSFVNICQIHGLPNATFLQSTLRMCMEFYQWRTQLHLRFGKLAITNQEYDYQLTSDRYPLYAKGSKVGMRAYYNCRLGTGAAGGFYCLLVDAGVPPEHAEEFIIRLSSRKTDPSSPSARLYNYLAPKLANRERIRGDHQLGMLIKCWNDTVTGDWSSTLNFPSTLTEPFPDPQPWAGVP